MSSKRDKETCCATGEIERGEAAGRRSELQRRLVVGRSSARNRIFFIRHSPSCCISLSLIVLLSPASVSVSSVVRLTSVGFVRIRRSCARAGELTTVVRRRRSARLNSNSSAAAGLSAVVCVCVCVCVGQG